MSILDDFPANYRDGAPGKAKGQTKLQVQVWYPVVIDDLTKLPDAISYYERVVKDGEKHLVPKGNLETLLAAQAGIVYFYETAYNDAAKIVKWMNAHIDYQRGCKYRWFQSDEGREKFGPLKQQETGKYIEGDSEIYALTESLCFIEAAKSSLSSLVERLQDRGINLSMIAKIRAAGQSEIMIDSSQESPWDE